MTKYHIAGDGTVKPCRAKVKPCPLGGGHFDTVQSAEAYLKHKYSFVDEYKMNVDFGSPYKAINANKRGDFVEQETNQAINDGLETHVTHYKDGSWIPERAKVHKEILDKMIEKYVNVPSNKKVIFSAGLPGAGKTTVLTQYENLDTNDWATVSSDDFKEILAEKGMIPKIEGLTPMESSTLVHEESSYLADELLSKLSKQGKNIIYDFTCKNEDSTIKRIDNLKKYDYETKDMQFVFVDIPIDTAKERAKHRYRNGLNNGVMNDYRNKELTEQDRHSEQKVTLGGRHLPEYIIDNCKSENNKTSSINAETLIKLHTGDLGLPQPIIYNNSGTEPIKKDYVDFLIRE